MRSKRPFHHGDRDTKGSDRSQRTRQGNGNTHHEHTDPFDGRTDTPLADSSLDDARSVGVPLTVMISARLFGGVLDDRLAKGTSPASSALLATRAQLIVSPTHRRMLAESWLSLLGKAQRPTVHVRSPQVPVARSTVLAAQVQIRELANALLAPLVTPRGVAMASALLSDGSSPIYYRESAMDLRLKVQEVIARLNPLTS